MSTGAAIAVITANNAALSAQAAQEAKQAKIIACQSTMPSFQDATATEGARQAYAQCVEVMYPARSMSEGETLGFKAAFVLAVLFMIYGGYKGAKEDGFFGAVLLGLIGLCGGPIVVLLIAALIWGAQFLIYA